MPPAPLSGNHQKLLDRLKTIPVDFEWREMETLLAALGFVKSSKKGSGVRFRHREDASRMIHLHKPHNRNPATINRVYLRQVVVALKEWGLSDE